MSAEGPKQEKSMTAPRSDLDARVTVNPNDTPDAVMRRYVAVYGDDAYDRLGEDGTVEAETHPRGYRARLLDRAHALLHRAEGRDQWGNRP